MKVRYFLIVLFFLLIIGIVLFKDSYAYDNDTNKLEELNLILKYDEDNLESIIYDYIDLIDESLIPTSSYTMSNILSNNYDFLTIFAINFILNNKEYYDISSMNYYTYNDGYLTYTTNKYINKDTIYNITDGVFGKRDYLIINDYLNISKDMVPLLLIKDFTCQMKIDKITDIFVNDNMYTVNVKYIDNDFIYKYIFIKKNYRLLLYDLKV